MTDTTNRPDSHGKEFQKWWYDYKIKNGLLGHMDRVTAHVEAAWNAGWEREYAVSHARALALEDANRTIAALRSETGPQWERTGDEASARYINAAPGRPVWFIAGDGQMWIYKLPPLPSSSERRDG